MKKLIHLPLLVLLAGLHPAFAQGTKFTYQGRLHDSGAAANGSYDLKFSLFNVSGGGAVVAGPLTNSPVAVSNGLFTVALDFGPGVFNGTAYWLQIAARTNGGGAFTDLAPRQELTPTPYAIYAEGSSAAGLLGTIPSANLGGGYGNALTLNNAGNTISGNGSGLTSLNASQLTTGTVADVRLSANVALLNANQTFTGANIFNTGLGAGRLTLQGSGGIDTGFFTGLGLQYYFGDGEGAIMSSYNDGQGYLTFYTKAGSGQPVAKQMMIDRLGGVAIDLNNANSGVINNGTTGGAGLTFGSASGEGIASKRTAGTNQYGLDFYTASANRMAIRNTGFVGIGTVNPSDTLHVFNAGNDGDVMIENTYPFLTFKQISGNNNAGLLFNSDVAAYSAWLMYRGSDQALTMGSTAGSSSPDTLVLQRDGNAGIGTAAAFTKLTVNGSIGFKNAATPAMYVYEDGTSNAEKPVIVHSPSFSGWGLWYADTNDSFVVKSSSGATPAMVVSVAGRWATIGSGTRATGYALSVDGKIACEEVLVQDSGSWPDYVFKDDYQLKSLAEVETHIKEQKHLPGIPTAKEVAANGISIGNMQKRMMEKIEELTLYAIEQNKRLAAQDEKIRRLEAKLEGGRP